MDVLAHFALVLLQPGHLRRSQHYALVVWPDRGGYHAHLAQEGHLATYIYGGAASALVHDLLVEQLLDWFNLLNHALPVAETEVECAAVPLALQHS